MKNTFRRGIPVAAVVFLACVAAASASDVMPPGTDGVDPWRLLIGVDLSTNVFSMDAVGESTNLGLVAFLDADILRFLSVGAGARLRAVEMEHDFEADSTSFASFTALGLEASVMVAVWQRDYVVPTERIVRREKIYPDLEKIWYYIEDVPHHGSIGIFAKYPLSFDRSSPTQLTPLSALIIGACLEARQVAIYDGMWLQIYFQRTSTTLPLAESMLVGGQALFVGQPVFLSFWIEGRPFLESPAAVPCGMSFGLSLDWR